MSKPAQDLDPVRATEAEYDLIVVGGGVQGVMTALTAAEAGRRVLVLERGRLGAGVTSAWFQILHGGLRYLQKLDVSRLRASSVERRWFMTAFPDLARPASFLMPLYNQGAKRPEVFRLAFAADAALTMDRNRALGVENRIPRGAVMTAAEVVACFPGVRREGLTGGALWTEAIAPDGDALFRALVERAKSAGAVLLEEVEARNIQCVGGAVKGVEAMVVDDAEGGGSSLSFSAAKVVNAAGPAAGALARRFDESVEEPLFLPALGFNLLLDLPPPSSHGLALAPPDDGGAMLFLQPRGERTFAGTWYAPRPPSAAETADKPLPTEAEIAAFLEALNGAAPTLGVRRRDVAAITAGHLPALEAGGVDLTDRDLIHDHGANGGPKGLLTLVGVKFTTARRLARSALARI